MKRFVLALTIVMGLVWLAARGTALAQTQSKPAANKALTPD